MADHTVELDLLDIDVHRYVAFTLDADLGSNVLWQAGVRYLIQADCPPTLGCLAILAAERKLKLAAIDKGRVDLKQARVDFAGQAATRGDWNEVRDLRNAIAGGSLELCRGYARNGPVKDIGSRRANRD